MRRFSPTASPPPPVLVPSLLLMSTFLLETRKDNTWKPHNADADIV